MGDILERLEATLVEDSASLIGEQYEGCIQYRDVRDAMDEIKRLRAKVNALHIDIQGRSSTSALLQRQNEMLQRKVEELERKVKTTFNQFLHLLPSAHIITTDQIDAAWLKITTTARHLGWDHEFTKSLLMLLAEFGIKRCLECGGGGLTPDPTDDRIANRCLTCNGHKWTKE